VTGVNSDEVVALLTAGRLPLGEDLLRIRVIVADMNLWKNCEGGENAEANRSTNSSHGCFP
jgi:hypothetical protein